MEKQIETAKKLFISYAPEDEAFCKELIKHLVLLQRRGLVSSIWLNSQVIAGRDRQQEIDKQLEDASIILLLVSSDFLGSDYYYGVEIKRAMERRKAGEAQVIPIRLRAVDWKGTSFEELQALPRDGKTINSYPHMDDAWLEVINEIGDAIEKLSLPASNPIVNTINPGNASVRPPVEANVTNPVSTPVSPAVEATTSSPGSAPVSPAGTSTATRPPIPPDRRRVLAVFLPVGILLLLGLVILFISHPPIKTPVDVQRIHHITKAKLQFKEIPIKTAKTTWKSMPISIIQGDKGDVWFTDDQGGIGKVKSDGSFTMIPLRSGLDSGPAYPSGITKGPDNNIWFMMRSATKGGKPVIGRFNVTIGSFSYFTLPSIQDKMGIAITTGPDGNLWYVLGGISTARIGCITVKGDPCGEYDLGKGVNPSSIISAGGKLWFCEFGAIGWMTPGSDTKPHIISLPGITPLNMAFGSSNGQIWFTEPNVKRLGHISLDGSILPEIPLANLLVPESYCDWT